MLSQETYRLCARRKDVKKTLAKDYDVLSEIEPSTFDLSCIDENPQGIQKSTGCKLAFESSLFDSTSLQSAKRVSETLYINRTD